MEKKESRIKNVEEEGTPIFNSVLIFGLAIPTTIQMYKLIWSDPCSDALFYSYELTLNWIATINALDGAAACGLGYIDYKTLYGNPEALILGMRKKRLAFAKFSFVMAIVALVMVDKPEKNSVLPLIVGSVYSTFKIGTQIGFNLTPEKFFMARTMLSMYNLAFLLIIWYKLR